MDTDESGRFDKAGTSYQEELGEFDSGAFVEAAINDYSIERGWDEAVPFFEVDESAVDFYIKLALIKAIQELTHVVQKLANDK